MKSAGVLFLAFYLPIHFAVGAFYLSAKVLGNTVICSGCIIYLGKCADYQTEMLSNFFSSVGAGLIILGFFLPIYLTKRNSEKFSSRSLNLN